jgi:PhnB protein
MSDSITTIPPGYGTVTPWLISNDAAGLIAFIERAFDGELIGRVDNPDGTVGHAELKIGTSIVMTFDGKPEWGPTPAFLRLYLPDAEATFQKAVEAGATAVTRVTHLAFGDKVGRVRDPFGNVWWLQQRVEDVSEEELARRWQDPKWAEAMAYVQSAEIVEPR